MPDATHCYKILGLDTDATQDQIKQAHRELVAKWHPDKLGHNPELQHLAQEILKEINAAADFLKSYQPSLRPSHSSSSNHSQSQSEKDASDNRETDDTRKRAAEDRQRRAEEDRKQAAEENKCRREAEARAGEDARFKHEKAKQEAADSEFRRNVRHLYLTAVEERRCIENGLCWKCGEPLTMTDKLLKQTFHGTCKI